MPVTTRRVSNRQSTMARPTKQYGKQYGKKATVVEVIASPPPQNKRKRAVSTELGEEEDGSYDSDSVIEESDTYRTKEIPLSSRTKRLHSSPNGVRRTQDKGEATENYEVLSDLKDTDVDHSFKGRSIGRSTRTL